MSAYICPVQLKVSNYHELYNLLILVKVHLYKYHFTVVKEIPC